MSVPEGHCGATKLLRHNSRSCDFDNHTRSQDQSDGLVRCRAMLGYSTAHRRRPIRLYGEAPVDQYQSR